jgi:NAD-dependent deacetylase
VNSNSTSEEELLHKAASLLRDARQGIALTGAGISTPSGIPDFRTPGYGLWEDVNPMAVASIFAFRLRPNAFFDWMRPLARLMLEAEPNPAHVALSWLEAHDFIKTLITQNIDTLHSRAGSKAILEVHGHMGEATCVECYRVYKSDAFLDGFIETGAIPRCPRCGGILKPNVILFGEQLPIEVLREAERAARQCDVMLVAGSSLVVSPVSDLPLVALAHGAQLIIINYEATYVDKEAAVVIHDDVATVLPRLVDILEGEGA